MITGFSGSGKSTLLNEVIYKGLKKLKILQILHLVLIKLFFQKIKIISKILFI
uniref:Uncharacterized protein n=1 Tax=Candidatus Phytoplasma australasiaticum subsp. australasiaticum TaxID=2832407 RepID=A0A7S7FZF3_9MOLU|nr:hypothetical protein H7685_02360 ['Parthenium hysterophorus' phyllody phytoplasma]